MFLQINMTHLIKHLSFGKDYPGIVNPLDGTDVTAPQGQPQHHPLPPTPIEVVLDTSALKPDGNLAGSRRSPNRK